jgi:iron-sulfur cluster repair protein YtfE (RIC family)
MTTLLERPRELEAEFLQAFAAIHDAMRRDSVRLPRVVARADSPAAWGALRRWFDRFEHAIVHHHQREDTIVWPELVAREAAFALELDQLEADHHALDDAMATVRTTLAAESVAGAIDAADVLADLLHDHLAREEAAAFPALARCFTAEEYGEVERRLQEGGSLRDLAFEAPWVLDGLPAERASALLATIPLPLRIAYRLAFLPAYRRTAAPLL